MKIIYFGSDSSFSLIPFLSLINSKHELSAFVYDDVNADFNVIKTDSIQAVALKNSIPLIKVCSSHTNTVKKLQSYQADVILVSCYARLIPESITSTVKKGCFNLHPSLLPKFRGPIPLFWQFQQGADEFGVSIHRLSNEFDRGNIVAQEIVAIDDGVSQHEANVTLSSSAGELVLKLLNDIENNCITEKVQDNKLASYQSYPAKSDFNLSTSWTAKRIFNFISAYKGQSAEFLCEVNGRNVYLVDVFSYQEQPYENMNNQEIVMLNNKIWLACQSGYLYAAIK